MNEVGAVGADPGGPGSQPAIDSSKNSTQILMKHPKLDWRG
jgi:hypothetical protein